MPNPQDKKISHSVSMLLNDVFTKAIEQHASDIHIEPTKEDIIIRFRVDGLLKDAKRFPLYLLERIISRIKVLSNLNISETRQPQDGRFELAKGIEMRASVFPTINGECCVIRILDQTQLVSSFEELGIVGKTRETFEKMIKKPYGLILLTGPTGSGKTTTLFSILQSLNSMEKCITTLEDPVELRLPLVRQTQVNPGIGFDFADGLRSLFRQNPDIIMVGEIRDNNTADIAIQAAMTGHLVISTLHTNDSIGALIRLREMNLEKFLITSATSGIIAQRLVRKVCPNCGVPYTPPLALLKDLELENDKHVFYKGTGCDLCQQTGYHGRTGIFEVLKPSEEINDLVYRDASWNDLFKAAKKQGMITLRQDGLQKAKDGLTSLEEIIRVTK